MAVVDSDEPGHAACVRVLRREAGPLLTVWPVLSEVLYLLRDFPRGQEAVLEMVEAGAVEIAPIGREDLPRIRALMRKYHDQPMDFADAALVCVAERERITRILTLDRRDFGIYRFGRIGRFEILP
ncbi:MAG: PIN domain-containing protein [Candidatus Coatesbacteria bacterium]